MTRYSIIMRGACLVTYDGNAADPIAALAEAVRVGPAPVGNYEVTIRWTRGVACGRVTVREDGGLSLGERWSLPTPAGPIPDDGVLPHGVPDVA